VDLDTEERAQRMDGEDRAGKEGTGVMNEWGGHSQGSRLRGHGRSGWQQVARWSELGFRPDFALAAVARESTRGQGRIGKMAWGTARSVRG
jgi:hypothetical protein